ncbi:hypothetical protein FZC33_00825 [Labrys sp. KNU-23]|uniref:hypothetical protein n=1 Tax=Labrys sp. KNU-23 TaxID=2789216 RepID=UPI0011ED730D|nr:hypothetical protein [Labrys sp. KNU-23]QEN84861.1 hypothetical protein FZC33_00825 [Labrys sp. KNU-23]
MMACVHGLRDAEAQAKDALWTFAWLREEVPMRQILLKSPLDDGFDKAIANWENEGGAMRVAPGRLSLQIQRDLLEREIFQAILTRGLDDEGAFRPFHSFPWAIRTTVVE